MCLRRQTKKSEVEAKRDFKMNAVKGTYPRAFFYGAQKSGTAASSEGKRAFGSTRVWEAKASPGWGVYVARQLFFARSFSSIAALNLINALYAGDEEVLGQPEGEVFESNPVLREQIVLAVTKFGWNKNCCLGSVFARLECLPCSELRHLVSKNKFAVATQRACWRAARRSGSKLRCLRG